jgi:iodotyrosine deiodinase
MAKIAETIALSLPRLSEADMLAEARAFHDRMQSRRTVRDFSSEPVDPELIRSGCPYRGYGALGRQPAALELCRHRRSGNQARDQAGSRRRRTRFYESRAGDEWLDALAPLGTDADKPFLETAPWLIASLRNAGASTPMAGRSSTIMCPNRSPSPLAF